MKYSTLRLMALILCVGLLLSILPACGVGSSGVDQNEYDRMIRENKEIKEQLEEMTAFEESTKPIGNNTIDNDNRAPRDLEKNLVGDSSLKTNLNMMQDFGIDLESSEPVVNTVQWKQLYFEEMKVALELGVEYSSDEGSDNPPNNDPYSRYLFSPYAFILADLNFDGIPELIVFGDFASWTTMMRIFTISQNNVEMVFSGYGNSLYDDDNIENSYLSLYRSISDGSFAYVLKSWISKGEVETVGNCYKVDKSTVMNDQFEEIKKVANFEASEQIEVVNNSLGEVSDIFLKIRYMFNGREVSKEEYEIQMKNPLSGYEPVAYTPYMFWDDICESSVTVNDVWEFIDLFSPE